MYAGKMEQLKQDGYCVLREMHRMHDEWPTSSRSGIKAITPAYRGKALPLEIFRLPDGRLE